MNTRSILAVVAGMIGGAVIIFLIQSVLHSMFPVEEELLKQFQKNPTLFKEFMLSRPLEMYLLVIISHALGILGGMIIGRLLQRKDAMPMFVIAGLLLLGNVVNFLTVPHPSWFPFADLGTSLGVALGYGGYVWGRRKKA